ncbi:MAG: hypothetical protein WC002_07975, partial [Candidatus Muiribacteriota bacterium]
TITASDWLGDYEYQPSGFMLTVAETNSTYVLSPEPDSYGYYEEGTVVTITATPESGNHFCYFKSPGITPYRGAEIPNVTTITMNSNKTLNIISSSGDYVVYVSNDNGNDTNDGLSPLSPVKTTGKAIDLVQNLIAEYTFGISPSPGLNGGPNFAGMYVVPEQGVEVRFEGNTSGQTYSDNTVSDEIFKMDDQLYFSLSGGWNFTNVETGQNILNKTILDGNETKRHITIADVFNYDSMPVIDISYISFQNGIVSGYDINDNPERGGAISIINADVNISYCEFLNNESLNEGGAIASFGNTNITDTLFDGNIANKGGAIYTECFFQGVTTIVSDSSFENNYAIEKGGAILLHGNPSIDNHLDIRNNTFTSNSAEIGGGIYVTQYAQILKVDSSGTYDIDTPFWVRDLIPSAEDGNENPYKNIFIDNLNRNENDSLVGIDVYFE